MKTNFCIIYNPVSGVKKSSQILNTFTNLLKNQLKTFHIEETKYAGYAKKYLKELDLNLFENIITIGGDGTFNEIINGLMKNQNEDKPTLGFIPGGSGNAFMHDLNATNPHKAIQIILNGQTKFLDILQLDYFNRIDFSMNVVGWGLASDILILSEKLRFMGPSRYTLASIYYILNKFSRKAKVIIDGEETHKNYLFILVLNTIHTGKGMQAAPNALIDDGLMDIILLDAKISKFQLMQLLPTIYRGGHISSKYVKYIQAKNIQLFPKHNEVLNIDGEIKSQTPISISVLPKKFLIYC